MAEDIERTARAPGPVMQLPPTPSFKKLPEPVDECLPDVAGGPLP